MTQKNLEKKAEKSSSKKMSRDEIAYLLFEVGLYTEEQAKANMNNPGYFDKHQTPQVPSLYDWIKFE